MSYDKDAKRSGPDLENSSDDGGSDGDSEGVGDSRASGLSQEFQYDGTDGGYLCDVDFIEGKDNCDLNILPFLQNSLRDSWYELHLAKGPFYRKKRISSSLATISQVNLSGPGSSETNSIDVWSTNPFDDLGFELVERGEDDGHIVLAPGDHILTGSEEFVFSRLPIFLEVRNFPGYEIFSLVVIPRLFPGTLGRVILSIENRGPHYLRLKMGCKIALLMAYFTFGSPFSQDKNIAIEFPTYKQLKEVFSPKYYLVELLDPEDLKRIPPHLRNYDDEEPSADSSLYISTYKDHFIFPQEFTSVSTKAKNSKKQKAFDKLVAEIDAKEIQPKGPGRRGNGRKSDSSVQRKDSADKDKNNQGKKNAGTAAAGSQNNARGGRGGGRGRRGRGK